jgi:hypothetical protein
MLKSLQSLQRMFGRMSKDEFAQAVIACARKDHPSLSLVYEPEAFRLRQGGDSNGVLNLHNIYEEYHAAGPLLRRSLLKRYVSLFAASESRRIPASFREAQRNLLPKVRERSYHDLMQLYFRVEGLEAAEPARKLLGDHLSVELVYDLPDSMGTVGMETLEGWGVGFDLALDVAYRNLCEGSAPKFRSPSPGVHLSAWKDNHDASRILLTELVRGLEIKGDPVAMVPHRDVLIVTGSEDVKGLGVMADLTEKALAEPRFMTAIPARLRWDEWVPLSLPPDHPLHHRFELLRVSTVLRDYDEQKSLLDQLHEKTGEDVFVASYSAVQDKDSGKVESYSVWSKEVVSLLPRSDTVHFFEPDPTGGDQHTIRSAPWERVREVAGSLLKEMNLFPERYLVTDFPTPDQVSRMAAPATARQA